MKRRPESYGTHSPIVRIAAFVCAALLVLSALFLAFFS